MPIPKLHPLPLRWRVALTYSLFLLAVVVALGLFLLSALENDLMREVDETLGLRAFHLEHAIVQEDAERLDRSLVAASLLELAPLEEFSAPGVYVQVLDRQGEAIAASPNLPGSRFPSASDQVAAALAGEEIHATLQTGLERVRVIAHPVRAGGQTLGVVLVGESLHLLDITLSHMRQLLLIAAAGAALISVLGGWWLTSRALRPIAGVTRVARDIAATGRFERRIRVPLVKDELGELGTTFNDMLGRLEKTFKHQREFLADASHELRGPLMVIRGNLDLLKLDLPPEDRQESAREATEEAERMSHLVSDLLFLAETDTQGIMEHQPVPLHQVVSQVLERARAVDAGAHQVSLSISDEAVVVGDHDRLRQMLWNLAQNALRYTPAGGRVTIGLRRLGSMVELSVADTGAGIPAEHLPRIFERFYRVDRARSRSQGSTGLGLAIVKQVAETHGGRVRVTSEPGKGSTFTVSLPLKSPRD